MDLSGTFDTTNALSCMFLWLIFGYLASMVNCDIQRFLHHYPIVFHSFGFLAFFFLFTLLDSNNKSSIWIVWAKTIFVYLLFVLMTKSKWYFVLPVLALLLIDQSIKKQVAFLKASQKDTQKLEEFQNKATKAINILIIVLIIIGTLDYMRMQKIEYRDRFSFYKFFMITTECKKNMPYYSEKKTT